MCDRKYKNECFEKRQSASEERTKTKNIFESISRDDFM